MSIGRISLFTVFALLIWFSNSLSAADAPSVELALTFQPIQKDIEIEIPEKAEYSRCKVEVEQNKKSSGWIVYGPNGQVLRRFVDTNGDNVVDQWRYFNRGLEVYRDIDTNFNNKVDGFKIKIKHKKYSLRLVKLKCNIMTIIKIKLIKIGKYKK